MPTIFSHGSRAAPNGYATTSRRSICRVGTCTKRPADAQPTSGELEKKEVVAEWAAAWAISRGKPAPVPVHNGFYLLDGRPQQTARYVFPDLREEVVKDMVS